jgi:hypothetical protein
MVVEGVAVVVVVVVVVFVLDRSHNDTLALSGS